MQLIAALKRLVPRPLRRSVRLRRRVAAAGGVLAGPFRGMRYVDRAVSSSLEPKILGTYELEVEDVILGVVARGPHRVVVVGAGEGYYAVGLAWRLPAAVVVAFEANREGTALMAELATRNGVGGRLEMHGFCGLEDLTAALGDGHDTFLLMDVEGAEQELLDPRAVPALARCEILVETHDCWVPGVAVAIRERFAASHVVAERSQRPRTLADVRNLDVPPAFRGALATWLPEGRPAANGWLWLRPSG